MYTPTVVPKVVRIVVVCGVVVVVAGGGGGGALLRSQGVAVGLSVPVKKGEKGLKITAESVVEPESTGFFFDLLKCSFPRRTLRKSSCIIIIVEEKLALLRICPRHVKGASVLTSGMCVCVCVRT